MTIDKVANKLRWAEIEDEDNVDDVKFLLPVGEVHGPDRNGIKTVIEYKFNEDGNKVKITTTTRVMKLAKARLSKAAVERRSWSKSGDAVHDDVGARLTMVSTENIFLEKPTTPGSKQEEKPAGDSMVGNGGAVLMMCRTCRKKGDHWTSRCPYKDLTTEGDSFVDKPLSDTAAVSSKGAYVPPGMRRKPGSTMSCRNEEKNTVRVTNLSEDTREPDLEELFCTFGQISRVYVAIDQKTGTGRGFGFVHFVKKEDAERAIAKLNGYGYDNLILRVEWASPRANF